MEKKIIKFLLAEGIDPVNLGFRYLIEALKKCQEEESYINYTISLYQEVGMLFDETYGNIERGIRNAIKKKGLKNGSFIAKAYYILKLEEEA